jgi:hypothetical protein
MTGPETPGGILTIAEVFRELFSLLEEYAPVWYTEEHHNRAVAALILEEFGNMQSLKPPELKKQVDPAPCRPRGGLAEDAVVTAIPTCSHPFDSVPLTH